ncbi:MAG TPA: hypothetical protein VEB21_17200 [Terriglobales bacterium]|nr:hypothetical protein [Terriglobales bacterium]
MGKMSILFLGVATVILLVTFGKGIGGLQRGDLSSHLTWSVAALLSVLGANVMAMIHAAQSDRIIRDLRARLEQLESPASSIDSNPPERYTS